jgi:hypothetical protein
LFWQVVTFIYQNPFTRDKILKFWQCRPKKTSFCLFLDWRQWVVQLCSLKCCAAGCIGFKKYQNITMDVSLSLCGTCFFYFKHYYVLLGSVYATILVQHLFQYNVSNYRGLKVTEFKSVGFGWKTWFRFDTTNLHYPFT